MSFCRSFNEIFMNPDAKSSEWDAKIFEYKDTGRFQELEEHLNSANDLYVIERQIYTAIDSFTLDTSSEKQKKYLLDTLKTEDFTKSLEYTDSNIKMKTVDGIEIKACKLTKIIPVLKEDENIGNEKRRGNCHSMSIKISKNMGIDNDIVTGYIYGFSDKSKYLHSWVEFNYNDEDLVIDYTLNIIMNKEGYYYIQHAEPLNRISDKSIIEDSKIINKFNKIGAFNIKEYLVFRDEIMKDFEKNKYIFDEER